MASQGPGEFDHVPTEQKIFHYDENMDELVPIRKSEYDRLCEHEVLFSAISEAAPVLMWMSGEDAKCIWFNRLWLEFRGRTLEQESGEGWAEGLHSQDVETAVREYHDAFARRIPFRLKYRLQRHDGTYRWILDHGVPRFGTTGVFVGYIGTCIDVTDLEQSRLVEQDTAKRLAQLAAIVETSDDVILSKDLNGIITSWNEAGTRVFGYEAEEMIGQSILKLIPEHLHSDEDRILSTIRAGRRIEHFETIRKAKDGRLIEVSLTISPLKGREGEIIGASKILRDITRQKQMEGSLLQAGKLAATGRMAATIAHEVNNPLEAVMNLLYLAKTNAVKPDVIEYLETAENELKRVSHIAKQTLGFYREHAGAKEIVFRELVQQALDIYRPRVCGANIELRAELLTDRRLSVRQGEMMQVISNLVMNSIYATPPGGTIVLRLEDAQNPFGVLFTVQDNGTGIREEDMPKIFEAFFTTRSTIGTGIGLFVSKQFVEGHGGTITIESSQSAENHGTSVSVLLPAEPFQAS